MDELLGGYGSGSEDAGSQMEEDHTSQQRSEQSGEGLDISRLTGAAGGPEGDTAGTRPASAQQQQQQPASAVPSAAATPERPPSGEAAAGEQAAGAPQAEEDIESMLPEELRQAPEGQCDPALQARVANWLHLQRTRGRYINQELRKSRGYRNPEFFQKMIEHLEIDQYGSAFPPEVFDPANLPAEDYLEALQKQWQEEAERRQKERAAGGGRIEFTKSASAANLAAGGGAAPTTALAAAQAAAAAAAGGLPSMAHNPLMPGLNLGGVTAAQLAQAQQYQQYMMQVQMQQQMQRQQAAAAAAAAAGGGGTAAPPSAALAAAQAKAAQLAAQARAAAK